MDKLAVVDCETTGVGKNDRIVEIAVVTLDFHKRKIVDEYETLINPERDVGPTNIHGITPSMIGAAPTFQEIAGALAQRLNGAILVAHNLEFDSRMIKQEYDRLKVEFDKGRGFCSLLKTGERLSNACQDFGIELYNGHQALADARATAELTLRLLKKLDDLEAAVINPNEFAFNPRTLRRPSSSAARSRISHVVATTRHHPYRTHNSSLLYLDALDHVLADRVVTPEERRGMRTFAQMLGLINKQIHQLHRDYLNDIIKAVNRDNIITPAEHDLVSDLANALGVDDIDIPAVTRPNVDIPGVLSQGMKICFTGTAVVNGEHITRDQIEAKASLMGFQPVPKVTQKGCDLLVAADTSTNSGKAKNAHKYGIPIMAAEDFLEKIKKT